MDKPSFEQLIREGPRSANRSAGGAPFLEYLELVRQNPLHEAVARSPLRDDDADGTQDILESEDPRVMRLYKDESLKVYNFFRDEFFGIEKTISQIVRYFLRLAEGRGVARCSTRWGRSAPARARWWRSCSAGSSSPNPSTPSTTVRCTRSRSTSCRVTCARSSRRCSASPSRRSLPCAASA